MQSGFIIPFTHEIMPFDDELDATLAPPTPPAPPNPPAPPVDDVEPTPPLPPVDEVEPAPPLPPVDEVEPAVDPTALEDVLAEVPVDEAELMDAEAVLAAPPPVVPEVVTPCAHATNVATPERPRKKARMMPSQAHGEGDRGARSSPWAPSSFERSRNGDSYRRLIRSSHEVRRLEPTVTSRG